MRSEEEIRERFEEVKDHVVVDLPGDKKGFEDEHGRIVYKVLKWVLDSDNDKGDDKR